MRTNISLYIDGRRAAEGCSRDTATTEESLRLGDEMIARCDETYDEIAEWIGQEVAEAERDGRERLMHMNTLLALTLWLACRGEHQQNEAAIRAGGQNVEVRIAGDVLGVIHTRVSVQPRVTPEEQLRRLHDLHEVLGQGLRKEAARP